MDQVIKYTVTLVAGQEITGSILGGKITEVIDEVMEKIDEVPDFQGYSSLKIENYLERGRDYQFFLGEYTLDSDAMDELFAMAI